MHSLHCQITYRPARVGWLAREDSLEEVLGAIRLSCCLWGGHSFPLLPSQDEEARRAIVDRYLPDLIALPSGSPADTSSHEDLKHLIWPFFNRPLFAPGVESPQVLDVRHALRHLEEARVRRLLPSDFEVFDVTWDPEDPLRHAFSAMFGEFAEKAQVGFDYRGVAARRLDAKKIHIAPDKVVPADLLGRTLPLLLAMWKVQHYAGEEHAGIYVGDCTSPIDLLRFWNLRASGTFAVFLDPSHTERLRPLVQLFLATMVQEGIARLVGKPRIALWSDIPFSDLNLNAPPEHFVLFPRDCLPQDIVEFATLDSHFTMASVSAEASSPRAIVPLSAKPFFDEEWSRRQHLVVSVGGRTYSADAGFSFQPPFFPRLNEHYGREFFFRYDSGRSEPNSLGLISDTHETHITLLGVPYESIIASLFKGCGIEAEPSRAGRICRRLIRQMGRLQACRVFKIRGVRNLIDRYTPEQAFNRTAAIDLIGNNGQDGKPQFEAYEDLHIEKRRSVKLKPLDALSFLLKKEVFKAGLEFECPNCELPEWFSIDDAKTKVTCGYCGSEYNVLPLLKDRDWKFKKSGLFDRFGNQEGAIPVIVLLQQLEVNLDSPSCYSTSMNLKWVDGSAGPCETDFVWVSNQERAPTSICIGECKNQGHLDANDVNNMGRVAKRLLQEGLDPYVLFAKLSDFSPEEIGLVRGLGGELHDRVILLGQSNLEKYMIAESLPETLGWDRNVSSLPDLARVTRRLHFEVSSGPDPA